MTVDSIKTHFVSKGDARAPWSSWSTGSPRRTFTWKTNRSIRSVAAYRVYALDLKGFGLTAKPKDGQYHMDAYTRAFARVPRHDEARSGRCWSATRLGGRRRDLACPCSTPNGSGVSGPRRPGAAHDVAMDRQRGLLKRAGLNLGPGEHKPGTVMEKAAILNPGDGFRLLPSSCPGDDHLADGRERASGWAYHDPRFVTPELARGSFTARSRSGRGRRRRPSASMMNPPPGRPDAAPAARRPESSRCWSPGASTIRSCRLPCLNTVSARSQAL